MRYRKRCAIFALMLCFTFTVNLVWAQKNTSHTNTVKTFSLSSLSYYKTFNKNEKPENIISNYNAGRFTPSLSKVLNGGIPKQFYWIHFSVYNAGDTTGSLMIDLLNSRLNETELYKLSGNRLVSLGRLGDFNNFSRRPVLHKNFIYTDSLFIGRRNEYFLFVNQVGHTFNLPIRLFNAQSFKAATIKDYLFDGVTYGVLLFVAALSFFFFLNSRHSLYLYYSLYLITGILWFLSYFGLGYEYLWSNHPFMNTAMAPSMASLNIYFNLQLCQILLRLSRSNRALNNLVECIKYALLVLAVFPFCINLNDYGYTLNHTYLLIFLFIILLAMIVVSLSVFIYSFRGIPAAKFYLISSLIKAGGIINLALLELGIAPAAFNMEGLLQTGIFIEVILMAYALALRYSRFKTQTFVKVIEAHENERALISKEIHDGISGSLTGINYGLTNFIRNIGDITNEKKNQLEKIFSELNKVQAEARHISHNTMPDYITGNTIAAIVETYINELQKMIKSNADGNNILQINFSYNKQPGTFSQSVKLNIFRIIQEILVNIIKHSKAANADILFSFTKKDILISAEDNGVGLGNADDTDSGGMGIKNIRTRVELLNGNVEVKSPAYKHDSEKENNSSAADKPGYGTLIKIRIPYKNNMTNSKADYDY